MGLKQKNESALSLRENQLKAARSLPLLSEHNRGKSIFSYGRLTHL